MGRRKIEMKRVKDSSSRQVTFSKRRSGIFKKANELATLCAAEVAIVVFSPGGKPYSFGHPSVDSVIHRFLNEEEEEEEVDDDDDDDNSPRSIPQPNGEENTAEQLNQQLNDLLKKLDDEKKRGEMLQMEIQSNQRKHFNDLDREELLEMKNTLEGLQQDVKMKMAEMEASSSLLLLSLSAVHHDETIS